jgi:hypothetical protein
VDVLAVERRDEAAVDAQVDLVRDVVGLVLDFLDRGRRAPRGAPGSAKSWPSNFADNVSRLARSAKRR